MLVCLSLGSNVGDRARYLADGLQGLDDVPGVAVVSVSAVFETAPWGVVDQPAFLNIAAVVETAMAPADLLRHIKEIEIRIGRTPRAKWGPRELDIDIVLCESQVLRSGPLTVPHPHYRDRAFVLIPLAEIAPEMANPETGETVRELADRFAGDAGVVCLGPLESLCSSRL